MLNVHNPAAIMKYVCYLLESEKEIYSKSSTEHFCSRKELNQAALPLTNGSTNNYILDKVWAFE